jgi:predicted TPR repeat methyltransferase
MSATLSGVDLSSAMIEKARERGVYDRLEVGELVEFLRKSPHSFDLIVATDVMIYVGELLPTFEAAMVALRPGGMLAFSAEAAKGDRFELVQRTRRYAHSKPYLQRMAEIFGLEERHFSQIVIRKELGQPVNGYLVVLRKPG